MPERIVKFIGFLWAFLLIYDAWLFVSSETRLALYFLLLSGLFLLLIFDLLFARIRKLKKINAGLAHILERSEEKRINSEQLKNKILLMIDDLTEGLLIVSKDDTIAVINSKAAKFLGVHTKQVLNKPVLDLRHLSNVKKVVFPLLFRFTGVHKEEIEVKKNFILELTIEPLVLGKNNIAKLIIMRDITKVKLSEDAKNQFISVAAHQLKTPLSNTRLSLKMLLSQSFGKINKEQKNILEKTYRNNESLIYIVEDLLKEARTNEAGKSDNRSLVDLEVLVGVVADFYKDEIKRKEINFRFRGPDKELPKILVDQERIKMVVQNLFDNAVKYTGEGGKIEVNTRAIKGAVEFSIKDSGVGIPEDQKAKIFTRFSRAANVIQSKTSGSGLGLAIAKDIIEKNHGKIWFESKEDEGSIFFFTLPIAKS